MSELCGSEIAVGHCVIANDCDRPYTTLVGVITSIEGDRVRGEYICDKIAPPEWYGPMRLVTPVNDFGVRLLISEESPGEYRSEWSGKATAAKYPDGKNREWQETVPVIRTMRKNIIKKIKVQS